MGDKKYIYIVQQRQEVSKCKIGITSDLEQRLSTYKTGKKTLHERKISRKDIMQTAQKTQNDEFYTQYEDIEKEYPFTVFSHFPLKLVFRPEAEKSRIPSMDAKDRRIAELEKRVAELEGTRI
jgi:predicted GIY-YIG superfamily endonuclease